MRLDRLRVEPGVFATCSSTVLCSVPYEYDALLCCSRPPVSTSRPTNVWNSLDTLFWRLFILLSSDIVALGPNRSNTKFNAVVKAATKYIPPPHAMPTAGRCAFDGLWRWREMILTYVSTCGLQRQSNKGKLSSNEVAKSSRLHIELNGLSSTQPSCCCSSYPLN